MSSTVTRLQQHRIQRHSIDSPERQDSWKGDLLSASLGAYSGKAVLQRHISDHINITHAGYLLKRSSKPYTPTNDDMAATAPHVTTPFPSYSNVFEDALLLHQQGEPFPLLSSAEATPFRSDSSSFGADQQKPMPSSIVCDAPSTTITTTFSLQPRHSHLPQHLLNLQSAQSYAGDEEEDPYHAATTPRTEAGETSAENNPAGLDQSVAFAGIFFGVEPKDFPRKQPQVRTVTANTATSSPTTPLAGGGSGSVIGTTPLITTPPVIGRTRTPPSAKTQHAFQARSAPIMITKSHSMRMTPTASSEEKSSCEVPSNYLDDRDGHIWRRKYCLLENGFLYFYRDESDAREPGARLERQAFADEQEQDDAPTCPPSLAQTPIPTALWRDDDMPKRNVAPECYKWETAVRLNLVGAVRSAEMEYGASAFELSAVSEAGDEESGDKLVLKAGDSAEMKEWLFQFHRSIASIVREKIERTSICSVGGDMHQASPLIAWSHFGGTDGMQPNGQQGIARESTCLASLLASPGRYHTSSRLKQMNFSGMGTAAFSPVHQKPICTAASSLTLSHGHGRSSLHRRRCDITCSERSGDSRGLAVSLHDSPALPLLLRRESPMLNLTPHPPAVSGCSNNGLAVTLRPRQEGMVGEALDEAESLHPEICAPQSNYPETERHPPQEDECLPRASNSVKYVPPHLRRKAEEAESKSDQGRACKKYVPPHLRSSGATTPKPGKYVPPHLRNRQVPPQQDTGSSGSGVGQATHGLCGSPHTTDEDERSRSSGAGVSMLMAFDEPEMEEEKQQDSYGPVNTKLGGCADPSNVAGSILDDRYIPRKASRLEKVPADPFGSMNSSSNERDRLCWEMGVVSECGVRESNEDAYLVTNDVGKGFTKLGNDPEPSPSVWENPDSKHSSGLFAVFDGHCGDQAARFAAERLISFLEDHSVRRQEELGRRCDVHQVEDILRDAIHDLDAEFCKLCVHGGRSWESGATALIAALVNEHLVIANVGDARGVMCRSVAEPELASSLEQDGWTELPSDDYEGRGRRCLWKQVTDVHSPSRETERTRIERANGWVTTEVEIPIGQLQRMVLLDHDVLDILKRCFADRYQPSPKAAAPQRILEIGRVCGELAVSRAIGDRDFKAAFNGACTTGDESALSTEVECCAEWNCALLLPYPADHSQCFVGDLISSEPDFQTLRVGEDGVSEEFLLLACDGLWDVMDADDAVRVTRRMLFEKGLEAKVAANRLATLAVHLGSSDNITVIVVRFHRSA